MAFMLFYYSKFTSEIHAFKSNQQKSRGFGYKIIQYFTFLTPAVTGGAAYGKKQKES